MSSYVLDASALLALLQQELGTEIVAAALQDSAISTVNWSEVLQKSTSRGIDPEGMQAEFEALGVNIIPFSALQAELAAQLWLETKELGLSLGDRSCLALAIDQKATALTADKAWAQLKNGISIQLIR
jgi:ribonuclease VapC